MEGNVMLEAFDNLLINYPFHPVLWTLYAVNRRFAVRKPEMEKSTEILHYYRVTRPWLGGVTDSIRDIIARDDTTKNGRWYAFCYNSQWGKNRNVLDSSGMGKTYFCERTK
jgi:hypothetical protein